MSTLSELIAERDTAMHEYASKLAAFRVAFVELAALDIVLGSSAVGYQQQRPGFAELPDPVRLRHEFATPDFGGRFADDIAASVNLKLARFQPT